MFTKIGAYLGTLAFVFLAATTGLHAYDNTKVITPPTLEQQLNNVVAIQTLGGDYCSGYVKAGEHVIVTAAHCLGGIDPVVPVAVLFEGDDNIHVFHVQKKGDENLKEGPDLMTLTTNDASIKWPVGLPACTFKPYYGESLNLIGGPLAYTSTISFGKVSNPDRNLDADTRSTFGHFIQYDGALMPGNSGGPAIDSAKGCVMGVAEMLYAKAEEGQIYDLAFLTPITELEHLH